MSVHGAFRLQILGFPLSNSVFGEELWREGQEGGGFSYGEDESVFEVGKLLVALLAAEHAVLLVHHLLVAVLGGTRLVEAVLFAQEHYGCNAGEVVGLEEMEKH